MSLVPLCLFFLTISRFILVTLLKVYNFITHKKNRGTAPGEAACIMADKWGGVATKKPETLKKQPEGLRYM